ncbi:hypothetical protein V6N13_110638 [Hibiscus sabdariffa]
MKDRRAVPFQQKGRIRFHEEAGSSNSHSGFSSLGAGAGADVPSGAMPIASATPLRSISVPASIASPLGVATATSLTAEDGIAAPIEATVGVHGSHDVLAVDGSGKVHITDNILFGDERDVFVTRVSHEAVAPVAVAPSLMPLKNGWQKTMIPMSKLQLTFQLKFWRKGLRVIRIHPKLSGQGPVLQVQFRKNHVF